MFFHTPKKTNSLNLAPELQPLLEVADKHPFVLSVLSPMQPWAIRFRHLDLREREGWHNDRCRKIRTYPVDSEIVG